MLAVWEMILLSYMIATLVVGSLIGYISGKIGVSFTRSWLATMHLGCATVVLTLIPLIAPNPYFTLIRSLGDFGAFLQLLAILATIVLFQFLGWLLGYTRFHYRFRFSHNPRRTA
jgi:hypothetical protein